MIFFIENSESLAAFPPFALFKRRDSTAFTRLGFREYQPENQGAHQWPRRSMRS
jgi:hypothetical protein